MDEKQPILRGRLISVLKRPQIPQYRVQCPHCEMVQVVAAPETATEAKDHEYDCISCGERFTIAPFKELPAHEPTGRERHGPNYKPPEKAKKPRKPRKRKEKE